jgi:periplasmic protein CpxP/Spy
MLNRSLSPKFFLVFVAFTAFANGTTAQDGPPPMQEQRRSIDERTNLLAQLELSPEQVQQLRRLNSEHRPMMNAAQKRVRDANRELDMAIYADSVSDDLVHSKVKTFQEAQAEVNRLRFTNELAIRKILTLQQLVRFREMRRRFAETRGPQNRPRGGAGDLPIRPQNILKPGARADRPIN